MPRIRNTLSREAVSERGHAEFITEEDGTILYTAPYGWLGYTGSHWKREDADAKAFMLVSNKLIERGRWVRQHSITEEDSLSEACEPTVHKVRSVLEYLKNLTRKEVELFDSSPDLLNVSNGVVNLKTGILTPHTNEQFFTYCLDVPYVPNADIAPWERFLESVVGGGEEIVSFLQQCVGYTLTGHTTEEKMFYVYGPTRSGKGVFTETLLTLLGVPLATEVDFTTFTRERQQDANNFDLAPLKPARFVAASESSRYERLNEAKVKQLTGGNYIRCAFKYGDHFAYKPQYKIWLTSNYDVNADPHDGAVWGRIVRFEFPNSHLGQEDTALKERLKSMKSLQGVLTWAIEGAKRWYQRGLHTPPVLNEKLREARMELDTVQHWLDAETEPDVASFLPNSMIRASYERWCEANGVRPLSMIHLGRTLGQIPGLIRDRQDGNRGILGIKLRYREEDWR